MSINKIHKKNIDRIEAQIYNSLRYLEHFMYDLISKKTTAYFFGFIINLKIEIDRIEHGVFNRGSKEVIDNKINSLRKIITFKTLEFDEAKENDKSDDYLSSIECDLYGYIYELRRLRNAN